MGRPRRAGPPRTDGPLDAEPRSVGSMKAARARKHSTPARFSVGEAADRCTLRVPKLEASAGCTRRVRESTAQMHASRAEMAADARTHLPPESPIRGHADGRAGQRAHPRAHGRLAAPARASASAAQVTLSAGWVTRRARITHRKKRRSTAMALRRSPMPAARAVRGSGSASAGPDGWAGGQRPWASRLMHSSQRGLLPVPLTQVRAPDLPKAHAELSWWTVRCVGGWVLRGAGWVHGGVGSCAAPVRICGGTCGWGGLCGGRGPTVRPGMHAPAERARAGCATAGVRGRCGCAPACEGWGGSMHASRTGRSGSGGGLAVLARYRGRFRAPRRADMGMMVIRPCERSARGASQRSAAGGHAQDGDLVVRSLGAGRESAFRGKRTYA